MSATLTIRLRDTDRQVLADAAKSQGTGLSGFVRKLAEAEAKRLSEEMSRAGFAVIMKHAAADPQLQAELDELGAPQWDDLNDDMEDKEAYDAWVRSFSREE